MKNYEKYKEKIDKRDNPQCYVYYELMGNKNCKNEGCSSGCFIKTIRWLLEEYVEPIKLSHDEYVILKNVVSDKFNMISRDGQHNNIFLEGNSWITSLSFYSHLFKFIKNGEQYLIKQLVADYEKEHGDVSK